MPRLQAAGYRVRASSRRHDVLEGRGWTDVECIAADALRPETLDRALTGVDLAYYLVHSMAAGAGFAQRDRDAARNFREAAARAGVRRIVYLGGLQASGAAPSEHLASRRETGDELRAGPVPVTELRAGIIVGPGSAAFEVIRDLVYHLRIMVTPRWVSSRTQPIALSDLLAYLVGIADVKAAGGQIFDVGGPAVLSYREMLMEFARSVGRPLVILPVPVLTPRLSSYWLDLVTAVPANVARALIDGLSHDLLADDRAIRRLLPIPLHSYREAVDAAREVERSAAMPARWTEGAFALRGARHDISYYSKNEGADAVAAAPAAETWRVIEAIGGASGWYTETWLWRLRGAIDRAVGGVGMRRGRRDAQALHVGDALDFWRVVGLEPGSRLTLLAEMRLPGSASLELWVEPLDERRSRVVAIAHFHPAGLAGLLYWYALLPIHRQLFRRMVRAIARRAEDRGQPALARTNDVAPVVDRRD